MQERLLLCVNVSVLRLFFSLDDVSRVVLSRQQGLTEDFINANYISVSILKLISK